MREEVRYWIEIADYDLETARALLVSGRFLYVGFMCHQAIEKILKGYYAALRTDHPPYTHNLSYLAVQSGIYEALDEKHRDTIDILDPLNVEARYPTHKERLMKTLDEERCKEILRRTEELYEWIRQRLLIESSSMSP